MIPKVDTFEHDIADEIRRKEANLAEIQAVTKSQQAQPSIETPPKKLPWTTIALGITLVLSLLGIGGFTYYYFNDTLLPNNAKEEVVNKDDIPKTFAELKSLSPLLEGGIGRFVTKVEKQEHGYVIKFNNYPAVFAYVTKNESTFIDEIAKVLPQTTGTVSTTTPVQEKPVEAPATTTPQEASSTTAIATTTKKQPTKTTKATTTKQLLPKATTTATITSTTTEEKVVALTQAAPISYFSDKTVSNQNMRIYTKDGVTVVYAFVNNTDLLIANSVENILTLRSAILR